MVGPGRFEQRVRRLEARTPRPPREGLEAHDRPPLPLLHAEDGLVVRPHAFAEQDVLEALELGQLVPSPEVGGPGQRLLDRPLHHPLRVEQWVVERVPVAHLDAGVALEVGEGRAGHVGHEGGVQPSVGGAQVGHGVRDGAPSLAIEQEQEAQSPGPVEAEGVALTVVLAP
jgi:hypothetical protein